MNRIVSQRTRWRIGRTAAVVALSAAVAGGAAYPVIAEPDDPSNTADTGQRANAEAASDCYVPPDEDVSVIKTVYAVGVRRNVSSKVMLAGFEAGWVESRMNNLDCGTYDSIGVFQQRPSQGWCDPASLCMNVTHASNRFFERAEQEERECSGCRADQITQRVQISCCPDRYYAARDKAKQLVAKAAKLVRIWPHLKRGHRGSNVKTMQLLLKKRGYPLAADGIFGSETEASVNWFKASLGLDADGVVGPKVWEKLIFRLERPVTGRHVSAAKVQLNKHGGSLKAADMEFTKKMADHVRWFRVSQGLSNDDVVGTTTWRYLLGRPGGF